MPPVLVRPGVGESQQKASGFPADDETGVGRE
jgi:hypothetical protein